MALPLFVFYLELPLELRVVIRSILLDVRLRDRLRCVCRQLHAEDPDFGSVVRPLVGRMDFPWTIKEDADRRKLKLFAMSWLEADMMCPFQFRPEWHGIRHELVVQASYFQYQRASSRELIEFSIGPETEPHALVDDVDDDTWQIANLQIYFFLPVGFRYGFWITDKNNETLVEIVCDSLPELRQALDEAKKKAKTSIFFKL